MKKYLLTQLVLYWFFERKRAENRSKFFAQIAHKSKIGQVGLLLVIFLCSFNRLDYNQIALGTPAQEVVRRYGEPYSVKDLGNEILEYRYIERVSMNRELVYENHYYLRVQDGRVVSKRFREENRQPFDQMYKPDPNYPHYP